MKEIREIIRAYDLAVKEGKRTAVASVVHVNGSSYRRPGARMLVTDIGEITGAISGGCLEGDALHKAMLVLSQQQSKLVTYDTNGEDDAAVGFQLGCEGVIQVLFEPIDPTAGNNPIRLLQQVAGLRQQSVLVTLFSLEYKRNPQAGTCLLLEENGNISGSIPYPALKDMVMEDVHEAMKLQASSFKDYAINDTRVTAFIEFFQPAISLVIVGAGNDAIPLTQMATILGWDVRIIDGRSTHAKPERFTSACQVVVSQPEKALEEIPVDERTVFVLMTHNYKYDLAMLKSLLQRKITYIGILGPRKKLNRMLDELHDEGIDVNKQQLNTIYGPVGLDIGAETPEEIALSIIAEIKTAMSGKTAVSLRNKQDVIHAGTITNSR